MILRYVLILVFGTLSATAHPLEGVPEGVLLNQEQIPISLEDVALSVPVQESAQRVFRESEAPEPVQHMTNDAQPTAEQMPVAQQTQMPVEHMPAVAPESDIVTLEQVQQIDAMKASPQEQVTDDASQDRSKRHLHKKWAGKGWGGGGYGGGGWGGGGYGGGGYGGGYGGHGGWGGGGIQVSKVVVIPVKVGIVGGGGYGGGHKGWGGGGYGGGGHGGYGGGGYGGGGHGGYGGGGHGGYGGGGHGGYGGGGHGGYGGGGGSYSWSQASASSGSGAWGKK